MTKKLMALLVIIISISSGASFAGVCGDVNADSTVNVGDAVYLINYVFKGGAEPVCNTAFGGVCGDVNDDDAVNVGDAVYLINYVFKGGAAPYCQLYKTPSTTKIISQEDTTVIQGFDTLTGSITLDEASSYAQNIAVGDIIIGQDDIDAPNGFLRKVISKTAQSGSIVLETDQATMMEAFETMSISETHQLQPSDVVSYRISPGTRLIPDKDDATFIVELDCVLYDQDGDYETTGDQIKLDGQYAFTAALFADIEISWFTLQKFEAGIETNQDVGIDLTANLQWEFNEAVEFDLAEFHLGAIPIGGVVWLVPTLTVEAHINGDLTVTFETGVAYNQQLRFGFGWADDAFYTISESTRDFTYTPPQLTLEFNFEPGVSLNASCLLYGVAGPYVAGRAGFHFQSILSADPCNVELTFDLEAILYAVVGIECDILDLDYNEEYQLYTYPIGEWVYPLNGSGIIFIDPEPDIINAPWSLEGHCGYSAGGAGDETLANLEPGEYTITWGPVSDWITPSNSTQTLATDGTVTFRGTYVEDNGTGTIVINPLPEILNAPWSLSGPDGYNASGTGGETLPGVEHGEYTINWGAVSGWVRPSNSTQTLVTDGIVTFSGTYIEEVPMIDIDGNIYQTVTIGTQVWMAENLKVTHYRNGDPIPNVTNDPAWVGLATGAYCNYNNDENNVATYGRLYNWYAVRDSRNIAPVGWHVPTINELDTLWYYYLGGSDAGGKLKEAGTTHWSSPNTGATNESNFTALPGGNRHSTFFYMGDHANFWSSTKNGDFYSYYIALYSFSSDVYRGYAGNGAGYSIRCVKD